MNISKSQHGVLWQQVWGLAAVQGSITLAWLIYGLYLPQLLSQFGFPQTLAAGLLIVESLLAVVMEPLMGGLSDRSYRWVGSRFPFISVGVILSSALFITLPAIAIFGNPSGVIRWVFIAALIAWALAMTVFRSPAFALLGRYAAPAELPSAASLLILVGGLISAFRPVVSQFLLSFPPAVIFAIGSFVLLGAAAALRAVDPSLGEKTPDQLSKPLSHYPLIPALALLFGAGAGIAWGTRFLLDLIPKLLKTQLSSADVNTWMLVFSLLLAIAALPAGKVAVQIGNRRAMLIGIIATVIWMQLVVFFSHWFSILVTGIVVIAAFSLILNGVLPFALAMMPPHRAGLGVGMYFGGFSAGIGLFGLVFSQPGSIAITTNAIVGAVAFLVAASCIAVSAKLPINH